MGLRAHCYVFKALIAALYSRGSCYNSFLLLYMKLVTVIGVNLKPTPYPLPKKGVREPKVENQLIQTFVDIFVSY